MRGGDDTASISNGVLIYIGWAIKTLRFPTISIVFYNIRVDPIFYKNPDSYKQS